MSRILISAFTVPLIACFSIPLVSFAALTTSIAFFTLLIRVGVLYFELFFALLQSAILPTPPGSNGAKQTLPKPQLSPHNITVSAAANKTSQSQSVNLGAAYTAKSKGAISTPPRKTSSGASLVGTRAATRDYEGVGGWRLPLTEHDEEEALWMGMNSRLELPALSIPGTPSSVRRQRRSTTGGSSSGGRGSLGEAGGGGGSAAEAMRKRVPGTASPEGYFNQILSPCTAIVDSPNGLKTSESGLKGAGASSMGSSGKGSCGMVKVSGIT